MKLYVYALTDPCSGERRYVGKSVNPTKRLAAHRSRSAARAVREWLENLGRDPGIEILSEHESEGAALEAERKWVAAIPGLLNHRVGGELPRGRRQERFAGFGSRVVALRRRLGMSQADLAALMGVSCPTLCRIERGSPFVSAELAVLAARALETTVEFLVTGDESARRAA